MSIASLIEAYGRTMTRSRQSWARDEAGGAYVSASPATAAIRGYLQQKAGAQGLRYGREATRHAATLYCLGGTDVKAQDLIGVAISGETRSYRVDSVVIPDDRATSDPLCHLIISLEEDLPRT